MNTITDNLRDDETDAVLTDFVRAQSAPGGTDLSAWMARYPAQAREIARLAANGWAGEASAPAATEAAATRMRGIGLAALRACRTEPTSAAEAFAFSASATAAPMTSLLAAAKAAGLGADGVAGALDLPVALFWKLHRRLIAPDSLPRALVESLADAVNRTLDEVAAYLRMPPQLAAGASYRSDDAPTVGAQESFADALNAEPDATAAQRRRWLGAE